MIDGKRVQELFIALIETRNKKLRMQYVAALRELLRPVLADLTLVQNEEEQHE